MNFKKRKYVKGMAVLGASVMFAGVGGVAMAADGSIDSTANASLTINKYAGTPTGQNNDGSEITTEVDRDPLGGVKFTICPVNGLNITNPASWNTITDLNTAITSDPAHAFPTTGFDGVTVGTDCTTVTTAGDGSATFGGAASDQGVYYVTETDATGAYKLDTDGTTQIPVSVVETSLPFLVTLPMPQANGSWLYNVNVYPKNAVTGLEKEAVDPGALGVGSTVTWNVKNTIPEIQADRFAGFSLRDVLDSRLNYVADSSTVTINTDPVTTLVAGTDYEIDTTTTPGTVYMNITPAGLISLKDWENQELTWSFETTVTSIGDGEITNTAQGLINNPGGDWSTAPTTGKQSSNWGALKITKHSSVGNNTLQGAIFQVFGSEADAKACVTAVENANGNLTAGCSNSIEVSRDVNGNEITPAQTQFTTDDTGSVIIPGLSVGINDSTKRDYWIVEIVAPAGYINATEAIKVEVSRDNIANATIQDVLNAQVPGSTLPATGGVTNTILLVLAFGLFGGATFYVVNNARNKNKVKA